MKIAGEMQIDLLHRHHLGIAAAGSAALHAKTRAERRLAQADRGALAHAIEGVAQADQRGGLAFPRGCRADGGHEDELALGVPMQGLHEGQRELGLGVAVGDEVVGGEGGEGGEGSKGREVCRCLAASIAGREDEGVTGYDGCALDAASCKTGRKGTGEETGEKEL